MYFEEEQNQMITLVLVGDGYKVRKTSTMSQFLSQVLPFFSKNSQSSAAIPI